MQSICTELLLKMCLITYFVVGKSPILYMKEYIGGDYNEILMPNNIKAKLARTRKDAFLELFKL